MLMKLTQGGGGGDDSDQWIWKPPVTTTTETTFIETSNIKEPLNGDYKVVCCKLILLQELNSIILV